MSKYKVDLNLFKVLDAIYTAGNLTRAAEQLNLTQPAVSHALSRLREAFGDELFNREGNQMAPTALTRQIIGDVREALHTLHVAASKAHVFDPTTSQRRFALSLRGIIESTCLAPLMSCIEQQAPGLSISSSTLAREDMESTLAAGDVDLAIDVLLPVSENIKHQWLTNDRLVVLARDKHPATTGGLSIASYLAQKHILVSSRTQGPGREDVELSRLGLQRQVALRCQHYFSACQVVQQTDMLLTMPENLAQQLSQSSPITVYPMPVDMPVLDVHLYWHINADNDPANLWLRQTLIASVTD